MISTATVQAQTEEALRHYDKGVELFGKQKYASASAEFAKAMETMGPYDNGYTEGARYHLAICAAHNGHENAVELLQNFIDEYPFSIHKNEVRFELGASLERGGRYAAAYDYLRQVDPFDIPDSRRAEYYYRTGYAAFQTGDTDEAHGYFYNVDSQSEYYPHATYYGSYINYTNGNLGEAKAGFSSLAGNSSYQELVPFYLLQIEFMEQNYPYVIEHGPRLLNRATETRAAEISRILAEAYFHSGVYEQSLKYMEYYESVGGSMDAEELYIAGFSNAAVGNYEKAAGQLSGIAGGGSALAQNAAFHLADCYMGMGDKRRALGAFALAASADHSPDIKEEAMFNQGVLLYELGGGVFNESISVLNTYVRSYPDSPRINQAREVLLAAYFNTKNYEAAYEAIKLVRDPDNNVKAALQKISYFRGLQYFEAGDYDTALGYFDESDRNRFSAKYTALTKFWRAEVLSHKGDYAAAAPLYTEYMATAPSTEYERVVANYSLGYAYFNLGRWSGAETSFNRFVSAYGKRDDMMADTYNRLGDIAFAQRSYEKAIADYDRAIALGSASADYARFQRAVMYGLTDRRDRKIQSLGDMISAGSGDYVDDAMYELGRTYTQNEQFNQGAAVLRDLVTKYPQSPYLLSALSELGLVYLNLGDNDQALRYYKQVVTTAPNSPQARDAMLGIRNIYVDMNDVDAYFDFARSAGIETNVTTVERDALAFEAANRVYQNGDFARARTLMNDYLRNYPRGAHRADALYALGESALAEGRRDEAKTAFVAAGDMPGSIFRSPALQRAARLEEEDGNNAVAAELYKLLGSTSTQNNIIVDGLTGYLRNVTVTGDMEAMNRAATEVLASPFVTPDLKRQGDLIRGRYAEQSGDLDGALAIYRTVTDARAREGAESRYRAVSVLFRQGKLSEAEQAVFDFAEQNTQYQYWMAKAFLVLGDIYVLNDDAFQAKATYQSIVDGYIDRNDGVVDEALVKLENLK